MRYDSIRYDIIMIICDNDDDDVDDDDDDNDLVVVVMMMICQNLWIPNTSNTFYFIFMQFSPVRCRID